MEGLTRRKSRYHFGNLRRALFWTLCLVDAIEHRVAVRGVESIKDPLKLIGAQDRAVHGDGPSICASPPNFCSADLGTG